MKILVISPLYAIAGVPLAQLRFARSLHNHGHDVDLIFGNISNPEDLPSDLNFKIHNFKKNHVRLMLFPLIKFIKKNKPDVIFSAEDHLNIIVIIAKLLSNSSVKISCSSRVTPYDTYSNLLFTKGWLLKQLMKLFMNKADVLTCVSYDMVKQYQNLFKNSKHICIYNIIDDSYSRTKINEKISEPWLLNNVSPVLIAAGKLAPWKGFEDLIRSMRILCNRIDAQLIILGDGPLKESLNELIVQLNLQDNVKLFGYVSNPLKYFKNSRVFVLSSHVEGLPNVLVEAMMCGCTPVATNCPTGPREVLNDGKYGYLVPVGNHIEIAQKIEIALSNPISNNLLDEAIINFNETAIIRMHFKSLNII